MCKLRTLVTTLHEVTSHILQTHTDYEVVALGGLIPTALQATLKKVQTVSLTPNLQHGHIPVSVQTDGLVKEIPKFGHVLELCPSSSTCTSPPRCTSWPSQWMVNMHVQNSLHDLDVRPKHDYLTLCNAQQVSNPNNKFVCNVEM